MKTIPFWMETAEPFPDRSHTTTDWYDNSFAQSGDLRFSGMRT
ncbi:hypothetical protein [Streptomyces sp. LARHCF252]